MYQLEKLSQSFFLCLFFSGEISSLSNPTLLHFAARFNLVNLCAAILQCPGSSLALNSLNNQAETPVQLAEKNGNEELAQLMVS